MHQKIAFFLIFPNHKKIKRIPLNSYSVYICVSFIPDMCAAAAAAVVVGSEWSMKKGDILFF
jgi:hypothetical protein